MNHTRTQNNINQEPAKTGNKNRAPGVTGVRCIDMGFKITMLTKFKDKRNYRCQTNSWKYLRNNNITDLIKNRTDILILN